MLATGSGGGGAGGFASSRWALTMSRSAAEYFGWQVVSVSVVCVSSTPVSALRCVRGRSTTVWLGFTTNGSSVRT